MSSQVKRTKLHRIPLALAASSMLSSAPVALAQASPAQPASQPAAPSGAAVIPAPAQSSGQPAGAIAGGTISGIVKSGNVPLPGVSVTATNTLTGKRYATTTDINGQYAMTIPKTGRYVVRAELAAFAPLTSEVKITAEAAAQKAEFSLQLASRAAAAQAAAGQQAIASQVASALNRGSGTQNLSLNVDTGLEAAGVGGGNQGVATPSLAGLDSTGGDSIAVSGIQGTSNGLASLSEDQIRDRINDAIAQARQNGGSQADGINQAAAVLGGILQGGGFGPGGGGGGGRGGPGGGGGRGGGGGGGGFRGFNPTQPHGAIFYVGGFPSLQAQQSSANSLYALSTGAPASTFVPVVSSQQNRYGVSYTGSPYIPFVTKPNPKQFFFLNLTGQRNVTPRNFTGTVPTAAERLGDFSGASQTVNGTLVTPSLYDPNTSQLFPAGVNQAGQTVAPGLILPASRITPQAAALLALYPQPNVPNGSTENYQTITSAGQNSFAVNARFAQTLGKQASFGGGFRQQRNAPPTLRQNVNAGFAYQHSASDLPDIIPILGGKSDTNGYNLSLGYTVGYGRLNNNATLTWNRSSTLTSNFFTNAASNPATADGISVPTAAAQLPNPSFYNGVPIVSLSNFTSLTEQVPSDRINQTISFSDVLGWSHKKHNMRFGTDFRRVHADEVGGNNPLGTFDFSGLVTESQSDQQLTLNPTTGSTKQASTGSALADLLLGQPQETQIQAGLYKTYLRADIFDAYAQDDFRVRSNVTLNYGLRYEYFSPYIEKNNRLVNLDHNANFTVVDAVQPGGTGEFGGQYPRTLVDPDRTLIAPRFGIAWRPKWVENTVVRAGYGINYNTGQFATFAQSLSDQPPFAVTQNNTVTLRGSASANGCYITQPGVPGNVTLQNGFGCSTKPITNNYSVDKNYRLGRVQVYNVDIQRSLPHGIVVNVGYNGSVGANLDVLEAPNASANAVTTSTAQAFTYETSAATSRLQQLTVSMRKRMEKGVSLQLLYVYGHSIDDASSIGGSGNSTVQNSANLDAEFANSSFDIRHSLTGNWVYELPFGPNRAFLSQGGRVSKFLDGFNLSGDFTFATGSYLTPAYQNAAAELAAGGTYTLRPDRVFTQSIAGPKNIGEWFNKNAFIAPANGFGSASRNSIEGPGTIKADMSLSRTVALGGQRTFEARFTGTNIFNTVQYAGVDTTENSATFGRITSTAAARVVTLTARYRF
jgi:hypothetical protein